MESKDILKYCIDQGMLIEPEVLSIFKETGDGDTVKLIIEKLKNRTHKRVITKTLFEENKDSMKEFFSTLPNENQKKLEKLKIKLGLKIEISKEYSTTQTNSEKSISELIELEDFHENVKVLSKAPKPFKTKIEFRDFVGNLRDRFNSLKNILQEHRDLDNLISISKLVKGKKSSIIGIVAEKRVTKNGNILFEVEDLTGKTRVLINQNKPDLYKLAEDITLDSVVGFIGSGSREIFFVNKLVFPDATIPEKKRAPKDEYAMFIGDLHYGSHLFLKEGFERFINYLSEENSSDIEAKKVKYLFIVGDLISGVGVYPSQIKDLEVDDLEEQFQGIANLLSRVRKDIKIIISPGNHDGVRLLEPQPLLDEKYAWPLYNLKNVIMTANPSNVNVAAHEDFSGFNVLTYHGFSYPYYANNVPRLIKDGMNKPEEIMKYLLRMRHLAPTHSSAQFVPFSQDELVIKEVPDIFVSGHSHKMGITSYNNILIISVAAWESETEYQRRKGNKPDFCKVPTLNLKTGAVKVLDFE